MKYGITGEYKFFDDWFGIWHCFTANLPDKECTDIDGLFGTSNLNFAFIYLETCYKVGDTSRGTAVVKEKPQ